VTVYAGSMFCDISGVHMNVVTPAGKVEIKSKLKGHHNASNILAVIAAAHASGISLDKIKEGIEAVDRIPGRLEEVINKSGINIFVDYAHTPDALHNVLGSLKPLVKGRLITLFGCGGDRDFEKRPLMGFEVAKQSDLVVVTSDNPRNENPEKIIKEIMPGIEKVGMKPGNNGDGGYVVIKDRREAICEALNMAKEGDCLLVAGKGHEDYQILGDKRVNFDDRVVIKECLGKEAKRVV